MNNLISNVNFVDDVIRELQKMESKLLSGQFIRAYRDCCSLIAIFQRHKQEILREVDKSQGGKNVK